MLFGHGYFRVFVSHRARANGEMPSCEVSWDTARHTLEVCSVFTDQCRIDIIGEDFSLSVVIAAMVGSKRKKQAVASFCKQIMLQKEADEQERERAAALVACAPSSVRRAEEGSSSAEGLRLVLNSDDLSSWKTV